MTEIYQVAVLNTTHDYFDYLAPLKNLPIGARVWVTLRGKKSLGIVIGKSKIDRSRYQLKPIDDIIDNFPVLNDETLALIKWASAYYQAPLSEGIKNALPKRLREGKPFELSKKANLKIPDIVKTAPHILNSEQENAVSTIKKDLGHFKAYLLFGVTGSGKTEVYCHLIEEVLKAKQQVLLIVPEIGLTPQLFLRLQKRFDTPIALLHSKLNETERLDNWLHCYHEKASILIGTRSAVFAPLPNLGLIIIDEAHDLSFKQLDGMRYSARDLALKRAQTRDIPIILGTGTPSLESLKNAIDKKYRLLELKTRAQTSTPNHYAIVDLRNQSMNDGLSDVTLKKIEGTLKSQKQVMIFINRRGFSPILICHACGWMPDCPRCEAHLTFHQKKASLQCHHCHYQKPQMTHCSACQSIDLIPVGAGTERVSSYLAKHFSDKCVLRIDKDTMSKKGQLEEHLKLIARGEADIIVGTQLLSKGHHFPHLQLVVILDADAGLYSQDFRALERMGQQITQVAGRAGRVQGGEVVIQTHLPDNPFLNCLIQKGYATFANSLLKERERFELPPFRYLALIRAKGRDLNKLLSFLSQYKALLGRIDKTLITLGPAPAPMMKKASNYHAQLLIKSASRRKLALAIKECREIIEQDKVLKRVRYSIDIDPQDLS